MSKINELQGELSNLKFILYIGQHIINFCSLKGEDTSTH